MKNLKIIGVTGTNGKTTTTFLIYHLLKKMGENPSLIGTIKYIIGSKVHKANLTTPGSIDLNKLLSEAKKSGSNFVVMEVSSHALVQERIKGLKFSRCLFTNLSRDHLDYHKTLNEYFKAKKKLFFPQEPQFSLINLDDRYGKKIFREMKQGLSFAISAQSAFKAVNIVLSKKGSCFDLVFLGKSYSIKTRLCGKHNVLNILGAIGLVSTLGFSLSRLAKAVSSFRPVEGRLEQVAPDIFIDYAHTPDALKNVLKSLREVGYNKIICVFGCGGDRDKGKRSTMGRVAANGADYTFITSDNPRSEEPRKICYQIKKGFKEGKYSIIVDRRKAIKEAIKTFLKNKTDKTCLLIAGKGHENYQIISAGDESVFSFKGRPVSGWGGKIKKIPFKDKQIVKEFLRK